MLSQAKAKYPYKNLTVGNITDIPFENESWTVFFISCYYASGQRNNAKIPLRVWQKLKPEGFLIFDFPLKGAEKSCFHRKLACL